MSDLSTSASSDRLRALTQVAREGRSDVRSLTEGIKRLPSESQKVPVVVAEPFPNDEEAERFRRKFRRDHGVDPTLKDYIDHKVLKERDRLQHELEVERGKLVHRDMDFDEARNRADGLDREARRATMLAAMRVGIFRLGVVMILVALALTWYLLTRPVPVPRYRAESAQYVSEHDIKVIVVPDHGERSFTLPVEYRIDADAQADCQVARVTTASLLNDGKFRVQTVVPLGHDRRGDRCIFVPKHSK